MTLLVLSEVGQSGTVVLFAGLMSMLSPVEGAAADQNAALLPFPISLSVCLWACHSRASLKKCQDFTARVLPVTLLCVAQKNSNQYRSSSVKCWKTWQKSLKCGTRVSSFATSLHSNTQEVKLNIKQHIEPYSDTNNCTLERLLRLRGSDLSSHKAKREQKERLERNTRQWVVIFSACCM